VSAADLPVQPEDPNDAEAYYGWTVELARVLDERGVLAAYRRELAEGLTVGDCSPWFQAEHPLAEGTLVSVVHELPLLRTASGWRAVLPQSKDVTAARSQRGSLPTLTPITRLTADQAGRVGRRAYTASILRTVTSR
jgi:hypothetical protein